MKAMDGWIEKPLSEVADITMGQSPDSQFYSEEEVGMPFLQGCAEFGSKTPIPRLNCTQIKKVGKAGALLFSVRAPVGKTNTADRDYIIGRGLAAIQARSVDAAYLEQFIEYIEPQFRHASQGSTFEAINSKELSAWTIKFPYDPREQRIIATILDTINEAIRRTEAVLAKLRQVKAGMLHDLLARGLDEHGELRDPLRHPEQFQDSPLGRIPKEWLLQQMSDVFVKKPSNGFSPKETASFTGFFVLGLGCLTTDGFKRIQLKSIDPEDVHPENVLQDGDLLLSRANTLQLVALPGIFKDIGYICTYPDLMMRLVPKPYLLPEFLELVLRYSRLRNHLVCNANGTSASMMKINATTVMNSPIIYPHLPEQERILKAIASSNEMLAKAQLENDKLKSIKQGLLHDLLTGHVRIPPHLLEAMS